MKSKVLASIVLASACMANAVTVSSVTARQRWPWSAMMDIDFTLADTSAPTSDYLVQVTATYANGTESVEAKTFVNEPVFSNGAHRLVWNLGKDLPNVKATDFIVTVTATPYAESTGAYLVFDLSGGSKAKSYPHWYTSTPPEVQPDMAQACKTTEMWFRRVPGGTITQGNGTSGTANSLPAHDVTISSDYYVASSRRPSSSGIRYSENGKVLGTMRNGVWRDRWSLSIRRTTRTTMGQFAGTGMGSTSSHRLWNVHGTVWSDSCAAEPVSRESIFLLKRSGNTPVVQERPAHDTQINRLPNLHGAVLRTATNRLPLMRTARRTVRPSWVLMTRTHGGCTTCTEMCLKSALTAGRSRRQILQRTAARIRLARRASQTTTGAYCVAGITRCRTLWIPTSRLIIAGE